jgi:enoyl-CoA hydratase/carnithine racemase
MTEASMSKFHNYSTKYQTVRMERRNGILQMTLHTDGGPLRWGFLPHSELPEAFYDVGSDPENRVVIITGTGPEFSGPRANPGTSSFPTRPSIDRIDRIHWEGRHLLMKLLDIEVPVISAINGPAWRHSEIPLLCDIVLAADTAQFQDSAHFPSDVVPGDGMHIVYPLLLGMNRGRYFLLTGQTLDASKALELGLVAEVLPPDKLLPRAWELAEGLACRTNLLLRYTRLLLTEMLRRQMHDLLGYGLGMEMLALGEKPEGPTK